MKKYAILFAIVFILSAMAMDAISKEETKTRDFTHTVLGEFGTATWCGYCKYAHAALKNIYNGGWFPFYYVSLVCDKNTHAYQRAIGELGLTGYPTVFFDGGYQKVVGAGSVQSAQAAYNASIIVCGNRAVKDIYATINVIWLGNATMNISVTIQNNETSTYNGHVHAYVTEIVSTMGWYDTWGYPYTFAFLDYAFNQDVTISGGGTWHGYTIWDGHNHYDGHGNDFGGIIANNTMVILAVFDNSNGYVDETVAAMPVTDSIPPQILYTQANPSIQDMYGYVNITAEVIDNVGVDAVYVNITYPDGTKDDYLMQNIAGTDIYYYNATYSLPGTHVFRVWSIDVSGNVNDSCCPSFFYIRDIIPPQISNVQISPPVQDVGKYVNITADITDNVAIASARINITYPDGTFVNETLQQLRAAYFYNTTYSIAGTYSFFIWAKDPDGNGMKTSTYSFEIKGVQMLMNFTEGWNFITIPCKNNYTASSLYAAIPYCSIILKWNASKGNFDLYVSGSPYDFAIEDGIGYFIAVTQNSSLYVEGIAIESVNVTLYVGWNMLGWFKENTTHASSLYDSITACSILLKWNTSKGNFDLYVSGSPVDFEIRQGEGFLVAVEQASEWHGEG